MVKMVKSLSQASADVGRLDFRHRVLISFLLINMQKGVKIGKIGLIINFD